MRRICPLALFFSCLFPLFAIAQGDGSLREALALQTRVIDLFEERSGSVARVAGFVPDEAGGEPRLLVSTGFFISKEGLLLTVARIPENATRLWVEYKEVAYEAHVLGYDAVTNVALLKTFRLPADFSYVHLSAADMEPLRVGSFALEISCKYGQNPAPGMTLLAGKDSYVRGKTRFPCTYLRCDMQGSGGEEGAPVFDLEGRFLGIIVASEPSLFVLPRQQVIKVRDDILFDGKVEYGFLGIELKPYVNGSRQTVLVVQSMLSGGAAEQGGLQPGDVVLTFEGRPMHRVSDFQDAFFFARPGQFVNFEIERAGDSISISVEVAPIETAVLPEDNA